jgi:molybdenum-dependent DNA-binding transcriptional regulator ModE
LARLLGVSYKTAWHMIHRIRAVMSSDPAGGPSPIS